MCFVIIRTIFYYLFNMICFSFKDLYLVTSSAAACSLRAVYRDVFFEKCPVLVVPDTFFATDRQKTFELTKRE